MRNYLKTKGKDIWRSVEEGPHLPTFIPRPNTAEEALGGTSQPRLTPLDIEKMDNDQIAFTEIQCGIPPELFDLIQNCTTAQQIWVGATTRARPIIMGHLSPPNINRCRALYLNTNPVVSKEVGSTSTKQSVSEKSSKKKSKKKANSDQTKPSSPTKVQSQKIKQNKLSGPKIQQSFYTPGPGMLGPHPVQNFQRNSFAYQNGSFPINQIFNPFCSTNPTFDGSHMFGRNPPFTNFNHFGGNSQFPMINSVSVPTSFGFHTTSSYPQFVYTPNQSFHVPPGFPKKLSKNKNISKSAQKKRKSVASPQQETPKTIKNDKCVNTKQSVSAKSLGPKQGWVPKPLL
ncbi:hypothetical protein L1887_41999 [Cichorium endivia]|nr:hypothetical protein L1887_41999 [Cichorium endivia]